MLPQPVTQSLNVLSQAVKTLGEINANHYGQAGVIPDKVAVPTPTTMKVQVGTSGPYNQPVFKDVVFILVPQDQYAAWRSAWAILMGYTGWWGPKAEWPLGDGERAMNDKVAAAGLPPTVAAQTIIQTTIMIVQQPTWIPDIRWSAIGALGVFVVGGILAWMNARNIIEHEALHMNKKSKTAAVLGWNLGRALKHMMAER